MPLSHTRHRSLSNALRRLKPMRGLPTWGRYLASTALVLVCFGVRYAIGDYDRYPFLLFLPAILLSAVVFDRGSGFLATLLSAGLALLFFVEPRASFTIQSVGSLVALVLFVAIGLFLAAVIEAMRNAVEDLSNAYEELRASEERFRDLADNISQLAWMADASGSIHWYNKRWFDYTGATLDEMQGWGWQKVHHPDHVEQVTERFRRSIQLGEPWEDTFPLRGRDGRYRWFLSRALPIRDEQGRVVRWFGTNTDITESREAQAALSRLNAELEARVEARTAEIVQLQKIESLGQLTGGVAHDFNNLLMAVLGSLELLKKRLPKDDPRLMRLVDNAVQGAERGAALTQRLLAFARRQDLAPEPVDVGALVRGMQDLLQRSLGPLVRIETSFPANLPPACADAHQLENALLNLSVNARDAMPGGGRLTISGREEVIASVHPTGLGAGSYVVLGVADTGEGMDDATLSRATEPFFTTKGVGKGTGLGLSMVHGLAAQSGGRLMLASQLGEGTTAELWLPEAKAKPAREGVDPGKPNQVEPSRARTVLVVDDDALVLQGTADMLEDFGHQAVEASSGRQALEIVRAGANVDVVITDYAMPGMTGLQLIAELRRLRPDLPVILASGYAELQGTLEAGLPRLTKPFRQDSLMDAIEGAMTTQEARARVVPFRPR